MSKSTIYAIGLLIVLNIILFDLIVKLDNRIDEINIVMHNYNLRIYKLEKSVSNSNQIMSNKYNRMLDK